MSEKESTFKPQGSETETVAMGEIAYDAQGESIVPSKTITHDAVFGKITDDGPNYRNVSWLGTAGIMMKISIGLGVLGIPGAFNSLGLIPGLICLLVIGSICTWCSYEVGVFKIDHPEVYGVDDAGHLCFGPIGRNIFATAFVLCYIFVSGSGMVGVSISLNALSEHGACTAVFVAVSTITVTAIASLQTLAKIQWFAWLGVVCIFVSVTAVTIAVGVQDQPDSAPHDGHWESDYKLIGSPSFSEAASALSTFVFAYAATPAFFPIVAEMKDPRHYKKALFACQSAITIVYIIVGIVLYYFCGSYVASPALGSAGKLMKKVCYGIALPGLLGGAAISLHLSAKYVFVRVLRNSEHLTSNSFIHHSTWFACTIGSGLIAYVIASAIPGFDNLVSLIGALLITSLTFQITGSMWLRDNWKIRKTAPSARWYMMTGWAITVVVVGVFLTIAGTYGSIVNIAKTYEDTDSSAAWSCADNSNS